ncbi:ankyrin repeat-containing domain protein [Xylaria sp. FL1042]|nr:ankyrin repeat-containing domain protein [Xylaria sp. FL1042]
MAEPFSILSATAGLADVSVRTSLKLRSLISEFKNAPALILALSNELTEISVVFERINKSRQVCFLDCLGRQLNDARTILTDLEALTAVLSPGKPANKGFRWLRQKKHAAKLKSRLKEVRERINELLVAHIPSLESRIKLELHEVRVGIQQAQASAQVAVQNANSNFQATSGELVAIRTSIASHQSIVSSEIQALQDTMHAQAVETTSHKQDVDNRLSIIRNTIRPVSQAIVQMAILAELAALNNASVATRRTVPSIQLAPSYNKADSMISFSMRLRGSRSPPGMSLQFPPMLRAAVGYLFLGYTGYPSASARCNVDSCARGKYVRLQVTYSFPLWLCLHYVMHVFVEASTSKMFTFALAVRRRMPFKPGNILYESQMGSTKTLEHVLWDEKGCIQDIYDRDGRSAFQFAMNSINPEKIEIMKLLLQNGADPDRDDDHGISPRLLISRIILSERHLPGYNRAVEDLFPLSSCIEALELSYVHKIVLGLLPISLVNALQRPVVDLLNAKGRFGFTPLMYAAIRGDVAAVSALVDAGAEVNKSDVKGYTALHRAILSKAEGSLDCVDSLLHAGADIHAVATHFEWSCLHLAAEKNQVAIGRRLIDAGANIKALNTPTSATPLWRAAFNSSVGMIRCLYDAGANLESPNIRGQTPLFGAAQAQSKETLALLLRLGANAAHIDKKIRTLLHHTARSASLEMIQSLTDVGVRGQDAAARDADGLTAQQLLDKRQPGPEMTAASARLVQV